MSNLIGSAIRAVGERVSPTPKTDDSFLQITLKKGFVKSIKALKTLSAASTFSSLASAKADGQNNNGFTLPNGNSIFAQLSTPENHNQLATINGLFLNREDIADQYAIEYKALSAMLATSGKYNFHKFSAKAQEIRNEVIEKTTQKLEEEHESFRDTVSTPAFKTSLGLTSEGDFTAAKEHLIKQHENNYKKVLSDFSESAEKDIAALKKTYENEVLKIQYMQLHAANNTRSKEAIEALYQQQKNADTEGLGVGGDLDSDNKYSDITMKQLDAQLQSSLSITGRQMQISEDGKVISVALPKFDILSEFFGFHSERTEAIMDACMRLKINGADAVNIDLVIPENRENNNDNASGKITDLRALKTVQDAFRAAVKAGFDPNERDDPNPKAEENAKIVDITLTLNGRKIKAKDVFSSEEMKELKGIKTKRERYFENKLGKPISPSDRNHHSFKESFNEAKTRAEQQPAAEPNENPDHPAPPAA